VPPVANVTLRSAASTRVTVSTTSRMLSAQDLSVVDDRVVGPAHQLVHAEPLDEGRARDDQRHGHVVALRQAIGRHDAGVSAADHDHISVPSHGVSFASWGSASRHRVSDRCDIREADHSTGVGSACGVLTVGADAPGMRATGGRTHPFRAGHCCRRFATMQRRTLIVVTKSAVSIPRACARGLQVAIAGAKTAGFAVLSEGELARIFNHPPPGHQIIEELIESAQAR
jgi:hypothetical protein